MYPEIFWGDKFQQGIFSAVMSTYGSRGPGGKSPGSSKDLVL